MHRYDLVDDLAVIGFSFRDLTPEALQVLEDVALRASPETARRILTICKVPLHEVAIISKCNAVLLVAVSLKPVGKSVFESALLDAWIRTGAPRARLHLHYIRSYFGIAALTFLHEVAVGLHSVTLGDSQVFAQTREGLSNLSYRLSEPSLFRRIVSSLRYTRGRVSTETSFLRGNTSLERIACDLISEARSRIESVLVVGTGMSARLLVEVLTLEHGTSVTVAGRNKEALAALGKIDGKVSTCGLHDWDLIAKADAIVVALEVTPETSTYVRKLYSRLPSPHSEGALVIDISSPGFRCRPLKGYEFFGIKDLSEIAALADSARRREVHSVERIIGEQLPIVAESVRMENLNRYLSRLEMDEVRGQQNLYRYSRACWSAGAIILGSMVATAGVAEVPKWVPFLSRYEIGIPVWIWITAALIGLTCMLAGAAIGARLWGERLLEGYRTAHVRKLVELPVTPERLDELHRLGSGTTGIDTFVRRETLDWLVRTCPNSVRIWTMEGHEGDIRCFYVVAPLRKRGVSRMVAKKLRKNRDLKEEDVCRRFRRASGVYIIEVWGADDKAKAAVLAALKISLTEAVLRSQIRYFFSRPVNEFGQRQLEKARFKRLGVSDREMWVKSLQPVLR